MPNSPAAGEALVFRTIGHTKNLSAVVLASARPERPLAAVPQGQRKNRPFLEAILELRDQLRTEVLGRPGTEDQLVIREITIDSTATELLILGENLLSTEGATAVQVGAQSATILDNDESFVLAQVAVPLLSGSYKVTVDVGPQRQDFDTSVLAVTTQAPATFGVPVGTVASFAGTEAPAQWLFADGSLVATDAYPTLFAAIGYTFGGEGANFALPDLRGRTIAGRDDMGGESAGRLTGQPGGVLGDELGASGGEERNTLTVDEMPNHSHSVSVTQRSTADDGTTGRWMLSSGRNITTETINVTTMTANAVGGDQPHNNVQPTLVLNQIIFAGN